MCLHVQFYWDFHSAAGGGERPFAEYMPSDLDITQPQLQPNRHAHTSTHTFQPLQEDPDKQDMS